jgi:hypothetical protein
MFQMDRGLGRFEARRVFVAGVGGGGSEVYEAGRWPAIILRRNPRAALVPRLPWAGMKQAVGLRYGTLSPNVQESSAVKDSQG